MSSDAISMRGVSAWYGTAQALFDVDLSLSKGEMVGLLGRNGAGKTTTFRSIMNIDVRRTGSIDVLGQEVTGVSTDRIARMGVGWVPEERRIFTKLTVAENLRMGIRAAPGRDLVPVDELVDVFPLLGKLLQRRGDQLSGGEQQVVAVARAIAARPRILLLDEPTEGLSPLVVEDLEASIARLPEAFGVTIVLAEQNLAFVLELTSRIFVLETGRLVHSGDTATFGADEALQQRYLSVAASEGRAPTD